MPVKLSYVLLGSVELTDVPFAPTSGLILPSAAGPLLDEPAKLLICVRLATAITFFACLCPPVTFPQPAPAPYPQSELPSFPAEKTCVNEGYNLICSSRSFAKDV